MNLQTPTKSGKTETRYQRPSDLPTALECLGTGDAVVLAGGTDLVAMRAAGVVQSQELVDVKGIAELQSIEVSEDSTTLGSAVTMSRIARLDVNRFGALVDGARVVGGPQTRFRATIGGNACRASPAGDTLAPLLVLGAHIELASPTDTRVVDVARFFVGPGSTVRRPEELAVRLRLPASAGGSAYESLKYRRWLDLAVAGIAVRVALAPDGVCADADIAVSAAAPTPLLVPEAGRALVGSFCDADAIATAAKAVAAAVDPIDDVRGTRAYRLQVLPGLLDRAFARAVVRARAQQDHGNEV
jgi:carbon-monoxide dehydrogenase medium subunit